MPFVEVLGSGLGMTKMVEAENGGDLVDVCDEHLLPVPFSCRSATCGTCHVEVLEGQELLEPPSPEESDLLELLGGPEGSRLACQARVRKGPGLLRLRSLVAEPR